MTQDFANQLISQLESDYNHIAGHFAQTRQAAWPEFESLRALIGTENAEQTKLLDIGCGNGRLANSIPAVNYTGLDLSRQLLNIAQIKYPQYKFVQGSMLNLPFPDQSFDVIACIATFQHIPSQAYRLKAMQEMKRILKPSGHIFMMNWNLIGQENYQTCLAPQRAGYDDGDYLIPWKNDQGEVRAQRYYHGFELAELASAIGESASGGEFKLIKNELCKDKRNIVTIAKRH